MAAHILRGNALHLPLADNTVDLICTSPPYFALRSYSDTVECDRCQQLREWDPGRNIRQAWPDYDAHVKAEHKPSHYQGQVGSEPTPAEYVDALIAATAEMVRVLKPSGSIWVNLGDKYAQDEERSRNGLGARSTGFTSGAVVDNATVTLGRSKRGGIPRKSLMGIPWRYALACIDQLGLILRAEVILDKKNGLPESVTDRVRRSHEQVFHFTKSPRYYSAVDEIRLGPGSLGSLPGSVWPYVSQPFSPPEWLGVQHFAAFNMDLPRRIIRGWSPAGICTACGQGRRPVAAVEYTVQDCLPDRRGASMATNGTSRSSTITGYVCACPTPDAPTRPAVVLDPFGGTGTTALVADALGRTGITLDMSADYNRLATWRTTDPGQIAAAMQVDKPALVMTGQGDLFEVLA